MLNMDYFININISGNLFEDFIKNNIDVFRDKVFVYTVTYDSNCLRVKIPENIWKEMHIVERDHYWRNKTTIIFKKEQLHILTFVDLWEKKRLDKT